MTPITVIVLGGGFAGVKCARTLSKSFGQAPHRIVLFNRENHMVFHPLLAEVASAAVQPKDVAAPLRQLLNNVECRTEEVLSVDLENKTVEFEADDELRKHMSFDHLVIACGAAANMSVIRGMDEHAFGLKTVGDALALQAHVMEQMEKAEVCDDQRKKQRLLSFVVVGGGFSGVELAGELNELVRRSSRFFKHIRNEDITVTIVHAHDELLPEVSPSLRKFAEQKMKRAGVNVMLNAHAGCATPEGVILQDGTHLSAGTVVCTIGTTPAALVQRMNVLKTNGRLVTLPDMSLPDYSYVWAVGDCAAVVNSLDGKLSPPVGQFAERQGAQVAANIVARAQGRPTKPFAYKMMGQLCSIGGRDAVAEMFGLRISGFPAWFLWRGVYLMKLPSIPQQIKVGIEWMFDLVFPRTLAHLKADRSKKVGRAYYAEGDWIFHEGDPATEFYMIQRGEVEVVREKGDDHVEVIAILGTGDFFGEGALLEGHDRSASVRARTNTELVVLGRSVVNDISSALTPLKASLAAAMKRRSTSAWTNLEDAKDVLESIPLESVLNPLPGAPLKPDSTIGEAVERINKHLLDFCTVANREGVLVGIVTRSDLLRAIEVAASMPKDQRMQLKVSEIMVCDPMCVALDDSTLLAFATMRERGMKRLPVVQSREHRIVRGYVRIENIMDRVVHRLTGDERPKVSSETLTREINFP